MSRAERFRWALATGLVGVVGGAAVAQTVAQTAVPTLCTTQSRMTAADREGLGTAALELARQIGAGDAAAVRAQAGPELGANFAATENLIHATAELLKGDQPSVTQVYLLDATGRKAGDASDAEFSCPLVGTASETDFSIGGLPPGRYGFAIAEETGSHPFVMAFLLRAEGSGWQLTGFYPHTRAVAGHDGLWFWTSARADAKAGKSWGAWVRFGAAEELLRPAPIASSSHLDRLDSERRSAAPPEIADGLSATTPLVLKGADGAEVHFTAIGLTGTDGDRKLRLTVRYKVDGLPDPAAARARNLLAARTLLGAHPDLRDGVDDLLVIADAPGNNPYTTELSLADLATAK